MSPSRTWALAKHHITTSPPQAALVCLASRGGLVYSTCSPEPEESEEIVAEVLQDNPSIRRATPSETARALAAHLAPGISASALLDDAGQFRTFPGQYHTDGFFAAPLVRLR